MNIYDISEFGSMQEFVRQRGSCWKNVKYDVKEMVDSIAVSVFAVILVDFDQSETSRLV